MIELNSAQKEAVEHSDSPLLIVAGPGSGKTREIIERINKTIDRGDKVVIWPSSIQEKDVNDMINSGHDVRKVIELNTYSGLQAKIKFNYWKKI